MLYVDQINPPLTQGLCLKWALKRYKQSENRRKQDNLVDAAASKPMMQAPPHNVLDEQPTTCHNHLLY